MQSVQKRLCEKTLHFPESLSSESFKDLFKKMIYYNPSERLSLEEIFEHEWVQKAPAEKYLISFDTISVLKNMRRIGWQIICLSWRDLVALRG